MANKHMLVSQGFRILLGVFAPYIARELKTEYGDDWWKEAVIGTLTTTRNAICLFQASGQSWWIP